MNRLMAGWIVGQLPDAPLDSGERCLARATDRGPWEQASPVVARQHAGYWPMPCIPFSLHKKQMFMVLHVQKRVSLPAPYPPLPLFSSQQDFSMTSLYKNLQQHPPAYRIKAPINPCQQIQGSTQSDYYWLLWNHLNTCPFFCCPGLPTHRCMSHCTPWLCPGHSLGLWELHSTSLRTLFWPLQPFSVWKVLFILPTLIQE